MARLKDAYVKDVALALMKKFCYKSVIDVYKRQYVRRGALAADIGCDHGKLAVYLARTGAARRVVAADIRPAPLARARALVEKHGCGAVVECRLGDGLSVLEPYEADDIVIAGVSGVTAAEMLAAAPQFWQAGRRFIFVPATKRAELRGWLWKNGFSLLEETPVQAAGRFYTALCAEYTGLSLIHI